MDNRFNAGDKVYIKKVTDKAEIWYQIGDVFTIDHVDAYESSMKYRGIRQSDGMKLWLYNADISAYKEKYPVIVITSDGKETKARVLEGHKTIREATAKCNDKDTFDFETGAKIAFERLMNGNNYHSDMFQSAIDEVAEELKQKIHKCLTDALSK